MIPDDRLRELLHESEEQVRPDPAFLDDLYRRLGTERRRHVSGVRSFRNARWFTPAVLAPIALVIAIVGTFALSSLGPRAGGPHPSASSTFAAVTVTPANQTVAPSRSGSTAPNGGGTQAMCALSFDPEPAKNVLGRILGSGFRPNAALTLVFTPSDGDTVTRTGGADDSTLISRSDGTMVPQYWDGGGLNRWTVSDGSCTATIATTAAN